MVKPGDFYLGISDFFSVLVPGFITASAMMVYLDIAKYASLGANEWIALLVAAYIFGHILFALGSYWDEIYELVKPKGNDELLDKIGQIRSEVAERDCSSINKYKWCRSVLSSKHLEGYNEVLRKEADSKLFRSMIVPLIIASGGVLEELGAGWAVVTVLLAYISFWRYRDQRFKACKIAYTHVIVLYYLKEINDKND